MANQNEPQIGHGQTQGNASAMPVQPAPATLQSDGQDALAERQREDAEHRAENLRATGEVVEMLYPISAPDIEVGSLPPEYDAPGFVSTLRKIGAGGVDRIRGRLALGRYSSTRRLL